MAGVNIPIEEMPQILSTLNGARFRLNHKRHWIQGRHMTVETDTFGGRYHCYCLSAALDKAALDCMRRGENNGFVHFVEPFVVEHINRHFRNQPAGKNGWCRIHWWNDWRGRKYRDVMKVLDSAIEDGRQRLAKHSEKES